MKVPAAGLKNNVKCNWAVFQIFFILQQHYSCIIQRQINIILNIYIHILISIVGRWKFKYIRLYTCHICW
jgi:hypothetical protein